MDETGNRHIDVRNVGVAVSMIQFPSRLAAVLVSIAIPVPSGVGPVDGTGERRETRRMLMERIEQRTAPLSESSFPGILMENDNAAVLCLLMSRDMLIRPPALCMKADNLLNSTENSDSLRICP